MGKPKKESKVSRSAHSNGDPGMESRKLGVVDFGRKQIIQFRDEIKIHMENISALRTKTDEKLEHVVNGSTEKRDSSVSLENTLTTQHLDNSGFETLPESPGNVANGMGNKALKQKSTSSAQKSNKIEALSSKVKKRTKAVSIILDAQDASSILKTPDATLIVKATKKAGARRNPRMIPRQTPESQRKAKQLARNQATPGKLNQKTPRPKRQAASKASAKIHNCSLSSKMGSGKKRLKVENTGVIDLLDDTLEVEPKVGSKATVKEAKVELKRVPLCTPVRPEVIDDASDEKPVQLFDQVDDEVPDPVQKKPKNAEKQKGAKKMLQLGHNEKEVASSGYKRSGSGAKRDRNVEDVNVEKEEEKESSAAKKRMITRSRSKEKICDNQMKATTETVVDLEGELQDLGAEDESKETKRSLGKDSEPMLESKFSTTKKKSATKSTEPLEVQDDTPVADVVFQQSNPPTQTLKKKSLRKSNDENAIHGLTSENTSVKADQPITAERYGQVLKPLVSKFNCGGSKFFSTNIIPNVVSPKKTQIKAKTPTKHRVVEEEILEESPIVRALRSKTPVSATNNATFNVNKTSTKVADSQETQRTFMKSKKNSQVTFREASHEHIERSGFVRPYLSTHQSDNTHEMNETGEACSSMVQTPNKKKYPVSPFVSHTKNNRVLLSLAEEESESEESCGPNDDATMSHANEKLSNVQAAAIQKPPVQLGGAKIVSSFKALTSSSHQSSVSNALNATRVGFGGLMNSSRYIQSPMSKTVAAGACNTPLSKKFGKLNSALTGSAHGSQPRSNIVSNVSSFWNPDLGKGLKKQKLDALSKERELEMKKLALEEKQKKQQERLKQLEERKKQEMLEKKRQNEERALKAKQNMANIASSSTNPQQTTSKAKPPLPSALANPPTSSISSSNSNNKQTTASNFKSNPGHKLNSNSSAGPLPANQVGNLGVQQASIANPKSLQSSTNADHHRRIPIQPVKRLPMPRAKHMYTRFAELVPENSDDEVETDDEEQPKHPVPRWAKHKSTFREIKRQKMVKRIRRHRFKFQQEVDLPSLFNAMKPRYMQRRSTAIWAPVINAKPNDSISFIQE